MGNAESSETGEPRSFPGSALFDSVQCGTMDDVVDEDGDRGPKGGSKRNTNTNSIAKFFSQAESLCTQSPSSEGGFGNNDFDDEYEDFHKDLDEENESEDEEEDFEDEFDEDQNSLLIRQKKEPLTPTTTTPTPITPFQKTKTSPANPTSALFARALVSEVTDNPKTMTPAAMAEREKKLLKAQNRARNATKSGETSKAVGAPGGIGQPSVLGSIAHALTGSTDPLGTAGMIHLSSNPISNNDKTASVLPPNSMSENRAQVDYHTPEAVPGKHTVTIGLSLSRRSSVGHPDTVTRQTAFDFNELQDRQYKYVSNTDSSGWRAGGGERGGPTGSAAAAMESPFEGGGMEEMDEFQFNSSTSLAGGGKVAPPPGTPSNGGGAQNQHKVAAPDTVHIPIIHIDAESPQAVDAIIAALARGEVFIPHMAIIPEALSVNGVSPPDLVVRFGTERNEDLPPDDWPNWCLEFMHNQLFEYFQSMGARWMKRPFSITLAKKVRWKTVKHMNRYFAHAERVIDAWREKGPQYLDPQLAYIEGGATPEEVARPHGIYLLRNGVPTNYFAPNFDPPYTTKMTRSLLLNVLGKSWDKKRREWTSEPIPRLVTPAMLMTAMCGCADSGAGGFIANEVTLVNKHDTSTIPEDAIIRSDQFPEKSKPKKFHQPQQQQQQHPSTPAPSELGADTDIVSEALLVSSPKKSTHNKPTHNNKPRLSLDTLNLEERKPLEEEEEDDDMVEESRTPQPIITSPQASTFSKQSFKELDDELDLHLATSSGTNSKNHLSALMASSPKYGRAPTPEQMRSPRSTAILEEDEEDDDDDDEEASSFIDTPEDAFDALETSLDNNTVSDFVPPSTTGTNSTIGHTNLSAEKFMKRELERRVGRDEKKEEEVRQDSKPISSLASDEDWLDELGKPMPSPAVVKQQPTKTAKKNKNKSTKEALEKERSRQIALIAMAQEQSSSGQEHLARTFADPEKMALAEAVMGKKSKQQPVVVQRNDSGVSLEYSVDSTLYGDASTVAGSLLGHQYAADASVMTASTGGSTNRQSRRNIPPLSAAAAANKKQDDEEMSGFSLQDSISTVDAIPTDEELFNVGWAKALDPKSGTYYYFTLDRTRTVWDNPLVQAHHGSADSMDSAPLPAGAAAI